MPVKFIRKWPAIFAFLYIISIIWSMLTPSMGKTQNNGRVQILLASCCLSPLAFMMRVLTKVYMWGIKHLWWILLTLGLLAALYALEKRHRGDQ